MIPNPDNVSHGRANPDGIAYLYLSTERATAIAEMRPWVGAHVSIAIFEVLEDLSIVDCSVGHKNLNLSLEAPPRDKWNEAVWTDIDRAFSRPIDPNDSPRIYAATQILAEVFLDSGYDGIAYKSGLGDGQNLVLFDCKKASLLSAFIHQVSKVSYQSSEIAPSYGKLSKGEREGPESSA